MTTQRHEPTVSQIVLDRVNLRRTLTIAAVVGTVLFAINQLDVVLAAEATVGTWTKGAVTYVVPFVVSNVGVVQGERRSRQLATRPRDAGSTVT